MGPQKAAFTHYINRVLTLPITQQARTQEWHIMCNIIKKNGFPKKVIRHIKEKEIAKLNGRPKNENEEQTELINKKNG
jgi:hypothetical protein